MPFAGHIHLHCIFTFQMKHGCVSKATFNSKLSPVLHVDPVLHGYPVLHCNSPGFVLLSLLKYSCDIVLELPLESSIPKTIARKQTNKGATTQHLVMSHLIKNDQTVMCTTICERRLISIRCKKERLDSKSDGQTDGFTQRL